jgi:hypothetical protein
VLSASTRAQRPGSEPAGEPPRCQGGGGGGLRRRLALTTNPRWLLRSTASGCGWRRGHGAITTNLFMRACPSSTPVPPTQLSKRICGALTNAKSARRATFSSVQSSTFGAPEVRGGHRHARSWRHSAREFLLSRASVSLCDVRRSRGLEGAEGAAPQRTALVPFYIHAPPPPGGGEKKTHLLCVLRVEVFLSLSQFELGACTKSLGAQRLKSLRMG